MTDPHYLRFVRTLALVSSIGGVGCGTSTTAGTDAATTPDAPSTADTGTDAPIATVDTGTDAFVATTDGGNDVDAFFDCASCSCGFTVDDAGLPECGSEHIGCCAAVGPLAPPDLAV